MTARARQRAAPWDWDIRESGPADAEHTVLLLPGTLGTAAFYDDLMAETRCAEASIRFVAATLPGQGGTPDVGHFTLNMVPDRVAEIVLEAVSA